MSSNMSSSIESSHNGPYFMDSDDSNSNIQNPAFIPVESNRIVMVSAPTSSDDEEEVPHAPPLEGESMELDGETVAVEANNEGVTVAVEANNDGVTVAMEANNDGFIDLVSDTDTVAAEANNDGVIDLESDTDIEAPKRSDFDGGNMELDGETVAVEANNDGVVDLESDTDLGVPKRSDFDDGNSSTDTEELLLSLKNCYPESESESELQILNTNFEAGGSSHEARKDQQPTLPPSRVISSMEKNKEPLAEKNSTSPVNGRTDVEKPIAIESEPVDPKSKKKPFSILDLLRQLASEEKNTEEDEILATMSLLEVAERRWGKF